MEPKYNMLDFSQHERLESQHDLLVHAHLRARVFKSKWFPAAPLRGRAVPCAARCGAAAMRSSFRLFVPPNGYFFFQNNTGGGWSQLGGMCGCTTYREGEKPREDGTVTSEERHRKDTLTQVRVH